MAGSVRVIRRLCCALGIVIALCCCHLCLERWTELPSRGNVYLLLQDPAEQDFKEQCCGGFLSLPEPRVFAVLPATHTSENQMERDSRQLITYPGAIYLQLWSKLPNDGNMLVIFGHMCFSPKMRQSQMAQKWYFNVQHIFIIFPMHAKFLFMVRAGEHYYYYYFNLGCD